MASGVDTILVVEDNDTTAQMLMLFLSSAGYRVVRVERGSEAIAAIDQQTALVLLDLMLPDVDGIELCKRIRASGGPPVLMLTARVSEDDVVEGLQSGADDYVCKPFRSRELLARIRLCLERNRSAAATDPIRRVGDLWLDSRSREAGVAGQSLRLTRSEFDLLEALIASPGRVYTRSQLIDRVLGPDYVGSDRTVDTHVWSLRRKIGEPKGEPRYLHAEPGVGYRLYDRDAS
ncbi:MAG: response regulator transcription factor [Xanthomonadales bacterium]|nr:response regulator transcription factor [Xanthomonadales bacterium]